MSVAALHAEWSECKVTSFVESYVLPALQSPEAAEDGNTLHLMRFTRRSAVFHCRRGDKGYAVKLHGPNAPPLHTTEAAFAWLGRLIENDPLQQELPTLRPAAILPEYGTIVTDWVDAPSITQVILERPREEALRAITAAIRWLDRFYVLDHPVSSTFPTRSCIDPPRNIIGGRRGMIPRGDVEVVDRSLSVLDTLATELEGAPTPFHLLHSDANCHNFFFDEDRAIGFDLHETKRSDPLVDIAHLLVHADVLLSLTVHEPPAGFDPDLLTLAHEADVLSGAPNLAERVRVHLLSACLMKYGRHLISKDRRIMRERRRLLTVADALSGLRYRDGNDSVGSS